jgi:hypothetical protein
MALVTLDQPPCLPATVTLAHPCNEMFLFRLAVSLTLKIPTPAEMDVSVCMASGRHRPVPGTHLA